MRARFLATSAWLLSAILPTLGCSELVSLGTMCPDGNGICAVGEDAARPVDAEPVSPNDSGTTTPRRDAGTVDGGAPEPTDAGRAPITDAVVFPLIRNAGIELTDVVHGDVTTVSLPTATTIAPWFTCQPIGAGPGLATAVRAEGSTTLADNETPAGEVVTSPDGSDTFVTIRHLVTLVDLPLIERLAEPLRQGQRYAIAIDVRPGNSDAQLSLQVRGGNAEEVCNAPSQTVLAETDPITDPRWQTACLPFTTPVDYTHLILSVKSAVLRDARLFFDNIRPASAEECPTLQPPPN